MYNDDSVNEIISTFQSLLCGGLGQKVNEDNMQQSGFCPAANCWGFLVRLPFQEAARQRVLTLENFSPKFYPTLTLSLSFLFRACVSVDAHERHPPVKYYGSGAAKRMGKSRKCKGDREI